MNQQRGPKFIDRLNKLVTSALRVGGHEEAPVGPRVIKREVDKLSRKLSFFYFDFRISRGEPERAAGRRVWILIATHCFYLRRITDDLGRINDAKLFCPVSGPNATTDDTDLFLISADRSQNPCYLWLSFEEEIRRLPRQTLAKVNKNDR
jgi:hypothetical protein